MASNIPDASVEVMRRTTHIRRPLHSKAVTDMDSRPVIRVAAAVIVDGHGRVLLVRNRGTTAFMQPGDKVTPGETAVEAM
jgi:hypothetical protein